MASLLSLLEKENPHVQPCNYMVLDVETRRSAQEVGGWNKAKDMGVSIAVLYDSVNDSFTPYRQEELPELFARLQEAQRIIGFNISGFDYAVLQPFANYELKTLPTLDLLISIKTSLSFRVSLDNVAKATLNVGKSASGMLALTWWKQGKIQEIIKYCQQDVEVTRQIYLYGLEHGHVYFTNKARKKTLISVDFK